VGKRWSVVAGWFGQRLRLLVGALGIIGTLFLVVAVLPPLLSGGGDSENDVRGTLLQALGGLVLLAGLYLTYRTFDLNRQGQVTERFTRAIDQLGEKKLAVKLGGIYALERIAWDSKRDHGPTMEVLTAFIREHAPLVPARSGSEPEGREAGPTPPRQDEAPDRKALPTDIQAILTVLGRRNADYDRPNSSLILARTNLQGADLIEANLQGAVLNGATLQGAFLSGANLQGAILNGANLQGAFLQGANLQGASLHGANLQGASLHGANLQDADLYQANLVDAQIDSATEADEDLPSLGAKLVSE
jgi:hypothetical protein